MQPSRPLFLALILLFRGLCVGMGQNCESQCSSLYDTLPRADRVAIERCGAVRGDLPRPVVFEFCQGVFAQTYQSACLNACDSSTYSIKDYDCPALIRGSTLTIKTGLKSCNLGRDQAIEWIQTAYQSMYPIEVDDVVTELWKTISAWWAILFSSYIVGDSRQELLRWSWVLSGSAGAFFGYIFKSCLLWNGKKKQCCSV